MTNLSKLFLLLSWLAAGLLGITLSLPLQSAALVLLGVASLMSVPLVFKGGYNAWLILGVLLAIAYFMIRAIYSPVADLALEDMFLIMGAGIFYLLAGHVIGSPRVRTGLAMMGLVLLTMHLSSAVMQLSGWSQGFSFVRIFTEGLRPDASAVTGMYGYLGSFANYSAIAGMLALCLGLWGRFPVWGRVSLSAIGIVSLVFVAIASSRSAILSLACGGLMLLVLLWMSVSGQNQHLRVRFRKAIVILGCLGLCLSALGTVWVFQQRAQASVDGADVMFDAGVRLAFWPMAIEQFIDHPLIGAGARSFSYECFYYWSPNLDTGEANPEFVHNEYLQVLADYGLLGFVLVVGLLVAHLVIGVKRINSISKRLKEDSFIEGSNVMALSMAGVIGIVIMSVHVMFDFRTHLLANLLLLICCLVWVLPVARDKPLKRNYPISAILALVLAILGGGALLHGITQLRGGLPLLENRMATETGSWLPESIERETWVPALEESIKYAPSYRRHLKLGTLYWLEAKTLVGSENTTMLAKAIAQYEMASVRHPYEAVSLINLGSLHTSLGNYEKADGYYLKAKTLASSRERWFRIDIKWADTQRQWAGSLWQKGDVQGAEQHYLKAIQILEDQEVKSSDTTLMNLMIIIEYGRMMDSEKKFFVADELFKKLEQELPLHVINSLRKNIRREMGDHYLRKGKHYWYNRQPHKAYEAMKQAERSYRIHQIVLKGAKDEQSKKSYDEVKQILDFFKKTGIGNDQ